MVSRRVTDEKSPRTKRPPATTPEARENQLISLAVDLAEQQMRDGTASSQVMTHFLKLGSSREKIEQERIAMEISMLGQKQELMASAAHVEELYSEAIKAMRAYGGHEPAPEERTFDD
jgi:hypothetical protein